jgi:hypothetical protein
MKAKKTYTTDKGVTLVPGKLYHSTIWDNSLLQFVGQDVSHDHYFRVIGDHYFRVIHENNQIKMSRNGIGKFKGCANFGEARSIVEA